MNARNKAKHLIKSKKIAFYQETLQENKANPQKMWATVKSLGLPNKKGNNPNICLKKGEEIVFDPKANANIFKDFYTNLAEDLNYPNPRVIFVKHMWIIIRGSSTSLRDHSVFQKLLKKISLRD